MINRRSVVAAAPAFMLPVVASALPMPFAEPLGLPTPLAIEFDDTVARRALAKVSADWECIFLASKPSILAGCGSKLNAMVISREERIDVRKMFPRETVKARRVPIHSDTALLDCILEACFRVHFNEMNEALKAVDERTILLSTLVPLSLYSGNATPIAILKDERTGILFEITLEQRVGGLEGYAVTAAWMVMS